MGPLGLPCNAFDPGVMAFVPHSMGSALKGLGCNREVVQTRAGLKEDHLIDSVPGEYKVFCHIEWMHLWLAFTPPITSPL